MWLVEQRDLLRTATTSASLAAVVRMGNLGSEPITLTDEELVEELKPLARRYIEENLRALGERRHARAMETRELEVAPNRDSMVADVTASADLGGLLVLPHFSAFFSASVPPTMTADAAAHADRPSLDLVLALDVGTSMRNPPLATAARPRLLPR